MKFRDRIDAGNLLAEKLAENGYTPAIGLWHSALEASY